MAVCGTCGQTNPSGFRFCGGCGASLEEPPPTVASERKVVSVLFCDLVGYTATTQAADPEDVSRMLGVYHAAVREQIERFGGVVEKFIGDAAVGVWGAPVAHEDDAERAVRAALAILDAVGVEVRLAVNTGEALVRLDQRLDLGGSMVGDVVNTASRLQAVAPVGGVLVGEATARATREAISYERLDPVALKGKPEPVPVLRVLGAHVVPNSDSPPERSTPFVGRDRELRLLRDAWERVVADSTLEFVTITGEPGIGKSRLVSEFVSWLDDQHAAATCRRGRCLAYGDGIGFWPLAEIIKQQVGLAETATEGEARARLEAAVEGMPDAPWLRARLAPLVGLPGEGGERDELFTAWQRFLDEVAARSPLVLMLEDLHWADPALLAFIQRLAEWSTGVPMLVLCTARPELHERHPGWAGRVANVITLSLGQLDESATTLLAQALLGAALSAGDPTTELVARSSGNPLYAEEYARLVAERTTARLADAAIPETIQALIAARIDTLPPAQKHLLQDASVIGKVFWAGAVASVGEHDPGAVGEALHDLAQRQHIRRARRSTLRGDVEYAFWHDLVQEVAYGQIPRSRRGQLHRRTGEWIEGLSGDRLADRSELLAHHYRSALELATASGETDTESLRRAAVHYLAVAGEQSMGLDPVHAEQLLRDARTLATGDDSELVRILSTLSQIRSTQGDVEGAYAYVDEARTQVRDDPALAKVLLCAISAGLIGGDRPRVEALTREGIEKLGNVEPTRDFAEFLVWAGAAAVLGGREHEAERLVTWAIEAARRVGDDATEAMALNFHGMVRSMLGDPGGLDELERSAERLESLGSYIASTARMQLADHLLLFDGPQAAKPVFEAAIDLGERIRVGSHVMWTRAEYAWCMDDAGEWDAMLEQADIVLGWATSHESSQHAGLIGGRKARVQALRDDVDGAAETVALVLDRVRRTGDPQGLVPALVAAALVAYLRGQESEARRHLDEIGDRAGYCWAPTADICRLLLALGEVERVEGLVRGTREAPPRLVNALTTARGMLAETRGDNHAAYVLYTDAADAWRAFGNAYELAHSLDGQARVLQSHGEAPPSYEARAIFDSLGVQRPLRPPA